MKKNRGKKSVALSYQAEEYGSAPKVIAKGAGIVAEKIIEKATAHNIAIYHDPALVEVLSQLEINQQIPPELYQVVAEVLSFVYRLNKST